MQLIVIHKILIATGITFFLFFGIRELVLAHGTEGYVRFALAAVAVAVLTYYFRWISQQNKKHPISLTKQRNGHSQHP